MINLEFKELSKNAPTLRETWKFLTRKINFWLLLISIGSGVTYGVSKCLSDPSLESRIANIRAPLKKDFANLFRVSSELLNIPRERIPDFLQQIVEGFGEVKLESPQYDPHKMNIFILPDAHVRSAGDLIDKKDNYPVQAQQVAIFHLLYALGVKRLYLEGLSQDREYRHDMSSYGSTVEQDAAAFKTKGYIADSAKVMEGVFGNRVFTGGLEHPDFSKKAGLERLLEIRDVFRPADKLYDKIIEQIAEHLGVPHKGDYQKMITDLKKKIALLTIEQRGEIKKKFIDGNMEFKKAISRVADWMFEALIGRNKIWSAFINKSTDGDKVLRVGVGHVPDLLRRLDNEKMNVFTITATALANQQKSGLGQQTTQKELLDFLMAERLKIIF